MSRRWTADISTGRMPRAEPGSAACVVVERLPFGTTAFQLCNAEVLEPDTLTVSYTDADFDEKYGPRVFKPGAWASATVKDANDNILAHFVGRQTQQGKDDEFRAALASVRARMADQVKHRSM